MKISEEDLRILWSIRRTPLIDGQSASTPMGNKGSDESFQTEYTEQVSPAASEVPLQTTCVKQCNQHAQHT